MDIERIKQNLRLRSGRNKKPSKKTKPQTQSTNDTNNQKDSTRSLSNAPPNGHVVPPPASNPTTEPNTHPDTDKKEQDVDGPSRRKDSGVGQSPPEPDGRPGSFHTAQEPDIDIDEKQDKEDGDNDFDEADEEDAPKDNYILAQRPKDPSSKMTDSDKADASQNSETEDFDLRPPAPRPKPPSMESMSELLFSDGHLHHLIYNPILLAKFTAFLRKYRPQDHPLLLRYLETSKAIRAVEYANAVAESASALPQSIEGNKIETSNVAAILDKSFQESCSSAFDTLLNTSLPLYITFSLIRTISECLVDEITGRATPFMQDVVGGLSEVFCLTDPNQKDNPIIYASEEFYRLTGYGRDDVIGHNCRFLQGQKTNVQSPRRLRQSLERGEETYETLLNYRRDGRPFINLLMIAPLHDKDGKVKYNIGAQIDVSRLIETGRVLDGFQRYLNKLEADKKREAKEHAMTGGSEKMKNRKALIKLRELSELFDLEETTVVQNSSRSSSLDRGDETKSIGSGNPRRRYDGSDEEDYEEDHDSTVEQKDWKLGQAGPLGLSGKLPGIYEKYMLIRPYSSLRIVFVSSKLRKFGDVVQSPFLSHVAAPAGTLSGLVESLKDGIPVSAKINFMPERSGQRNGTKIEPNERHEDGKYGRACWMSATPLLGGDDKVGVWMIVFVEKAQAKAQANRSRGRQPQDIGFQSQRPDVQKPKPGKDQIPKQKTPGPPGTNVGTTAEEKHNSSPIKPRKLDAIHFTSERPNSSPVKSAYQYQAATPIEEYCSAGEDEGSASPIASAPRADMPPNTPKYEHDGEEEFVRPTSVNSPSPSPHRLRISPDSDGEVEVTDKARSQTRPDSTSNVEDEFVLEDPNDISPSVPSDHEPLSAGEEDFSVEPSTPGRSTSMENKHNSGINSSETIRNRESPEPKSPLQSVSEYSPRPPSQSTPDRTSPARKGGALPAGLSYMDYLRHPSSRKASEDIRRGRTKNREGSGDEAKIDSDCESSPYSVD